MNLSQRETGTAIKQRIILTRSVLQEHKSPKKGLFCKFWKKSIQIITKSNHFVLGPKSRYITFFNLPRPATATAITATTTTATA